MFVSRKNLSLIHLFPVEASPRLDVLQSLHQSVELLCAAASCRKLFQPFPEHSIKRLMLRFGQKARLLNQSLICTEGDVFHTKAVYTIFVQRASALLRGDLVALCFPHFIQSVGKIWERTQEFEIPLKPHRISGRVFLYCGLEVGCLIATTCETWASFSSGQEKHNFGPIRPPDGSIIRAMASLCSMASKNLEMYKTFAL